MMLFLILFAAFSQHLVGGWTNFYAAESFHSVESSDSEISLEFSLPGVGKSDCRVFFTDTGLLVVEVKQKDSDQKKGKSCDKKTDSFRPVFTQSFARLKSQNIEKSEAKMKNGVLTVSIKLKAEKQHAIEVKD